MTHVTYYECAIKQAGTKKPARVSPGGLPQSLSKGLELFVDQGHLIEAVALQGVHDGHEVAVDHVPVGADVNALLGRRQGRIISGEAGRQVGREAFHRGRLLTDEDALAAL